MAKSKWMWVLGILVVAYVGYSLYAGNWMLKKKGTVV